MKKILRLACIATIFITSCTRNVSTPSGSNNNSNGTTVTGNFSITQFTDNNASEDKTADFAGYSFQFTADGKIIAIKGSIRVEGTYVQRASHENEGAKLDISFGSDDLKALNKNWLIVKITDSEIDLKDDDATSNEALQFSAL